MQHNPHMPHRSACRGAFQREYRRIVVADRTASLSPGRLDTTGLSRSGCDEAIPGQADVLVTGPPVSMTESVLPSAVNTR